MVCGGNNAVGVHLFALFVWRHACRVGRSPAWPTLLAHTYLHTFPPPQSMCYSNPELLDALLSHLADQMAAYIKYQIESGAQCVQVRGEGRARGAGLQVLPGPSPVPLSSSVHNQPPS